MRYLPFFLFLLGFCFAGTVRAQYASQKDAAYIATLKAVADYKINDEENLDKMEQLRQDQRFNQKLRQMLAKLNNNRTKTGTNRKVYDILKRAGKEIYDELN